MTRGKPVNQSASNTQRLDSKNDQIMQDIVEAVSDALRDTLVDSIEFLYCQCYCYYSN